MGRRKVFSQSFGQVWPLLLATVVVLTMWPWPMAGALSGSFYGQRQCDLANLDLTANDIEQQVQKLIAKKEMESAARSREVNNLLDLLTMVQTPRTSPEETQAKGRQKLIEAIRGDILKLAVESIAESLLTAKYESDEMLGRVIMRLRDFDKVLARIMWENVIDRVYGFIDSGVMVNAIYNYCNHLECEGLQLLGYLYAKHVHHMDYDETLALNVGILYQHFLQDEKDKSRWQPLLASLPQTVHDLIFSERFNIRNWASGNWLFSEYLASNQSRSAPRPVFAWVAAYDYTPPQVCTCSTSREKPKETTKKKIDMWKIHFSRGTSISILFVNDFHGSCIEYLGENLSQHGLFTAVERMRPLWLTHYVWELRLTSPNRMLFINAESRRILCMLPTLHDPQRRDVGTLPMTDPIPEECYWYTQWAM